VTGRERHRTTVRARQRDPPGDPACRPCRWLGVRYSCPCRRADGRLFLTAKPPFLNCGRWASTYDADGNLAYGA